MEQINQVQYEYLDIGRIIHDKFYEYDNYDHTNLIYFLEVYSF